MLVLTEGAWTSVAATLCRATARFTKPVTPYKFSACTHSRAFPCPHHRSQWRHSMFLRPGHDLRSSFLYRKGSVGEALRCCLGEVHLPCWRFIVVRHGGQVQISLPCGVKMTPDEILTEHVVDIHRIEADFCDAFERNQASSSHMASTNTFLLHHLCRRGSAFTTGTLGPDEVRKKMLSRNKLRESGISLPYKKLLTMSNTKSFTNDFT